MLLCEAEEYMEMLHAACPDRGVRYKEATEIAILCIEAQMRLVNLLNTLNQLKNNVFLSEDHVREILEEFRYDWNEYGEGPYAEHEEEESDRE